MFYLGLNVGVLTCTKSNCSIGNSGSKSDGFMKLITMGLQRVNQKKNLAQEIYCNILGVGPYLRQKLKRSQM